MHPPGKDSDKSRLSLRFFRWYCRPELLRFIEGDLLELHAERVAIKGKRIADMKMAFDVLLLIRPGIVRPIGGVQLNNQYDMFKNYFKTGIRNIVKYKVFSFINVFGLALAMSVSMLIILMLSDQKRYDDFHVNKDRVYRLLSDYKESRMAYSTTPYPLARALKEEYPIVEETTTLTPGPGGEATYKDHMTELRGYFADPGFFTVFSFDLVAGDKATALTLPNTVVISTDAAKRLFGTENPIGKVIEFSDRQLPFPQDYGTVASAPVSWGSFTVTGVIDEDRYKSHLKYDVLMSSSSREQLVTEKKITDFRDDWKTYSYSYTYAMLKPGKTKTDLDNALLSLVKHRASNFQSEEIKEFNLKSQVLSDIQLNLMANDTNNRLPRIGYYFLIILAIVIMISACLNYMNLSIARALTRAKEIGVRKVTGARRVDLVFQFLSESVIITVLSMMLGAVMLLAIKPAFTGLWVNQYLNFELPQTFGVYGLFIGFAVLIGLVAGLYPALTLAGYQPVKALKNLENKRRGGFGLRKVLSVSQFAISLFFITTSILIFRQFNYFLEFDYGFNSNNVVNIEMQGVPYQKLFTEFSTVSGIASVSASDIIPSTGRNNGTSVKETGTKDEYTDVGSLITDSNFLTTLDIPLIAGRPLPPPVSDSASHFILVNKALALKFGYQNPADIVGQVLESKWGNGMFEVIGVTGDFRYNLLINRQNVDPLIMRNVPRDFATISVRLNSADSRSAIALLEEKWKQIDPVHPFRYRFYDEQLSATHQGIFDLVSVLGFIALLAVTIACLGLLGMATYTAERRKKEVGIRKVMGAEEFSIILLLSKEFFRIVLIAVLIAAPLSYFINNLWLQKLPTRVEFGYQTVIIGTLVMITLGMITIGSQTFRAAKTNPVDSLRME